MFASLQWSILMNYYVSYVYKKVNIRYSEYINITINELLYHYIECYSVTFINVIFIIYVLLLTFKSLLFRN